MSVLEGFIRLVAFCAIVIVVTLGVLLIARYGFRLHVADAPYFLLHIVHEANAKLSSSPLPDVSRWISTLTWLESDMRRALADIFQVRITLIEETELDLVECGWNLLALFCLSAFTVFLPVVLALSHALLLFDERHGDETTWIMMILSLPLGALFAVVSLLGTLALWVLFFFDNITVSYFVGWLFVGLFAIKWGASIGIYLLFAPIEYCIPNQAVGSLSKLTFLRALSPRILLSKVICGIAWLHYFFVPHPATKAIKAGRRYRIPDKIDPRGYATAMKCDTDLDPQNLPPAFKSENQRRRAEELQKLAEADRKLLEELEARERARRKMTRAKRGEE